MENKKNIFEKLFEVKKAGIKLIRDTKAFNYKYATLNQIQEKLNPFLEENKLLITHKILENKVITEIINIENCDEKIFSEIVMSEGTKAQDKGSEITYYRRYNLLSLLDLEVDDDDGKKAQDSGRNTKTKEKADDDKPWMNEATFEKLKENIEKFENAEDAIKKARMKYKVSNAFADRITDLF